MRHSEYCREAPLTWQGVCDLAQKVPWFDRNPTKWADFYCAMAMKKDSLARLVYNVSDEPVIAAVVSTMWPGVGTVENMVDPLAIIESRGGISREIKSWLRDAMSGLKLHRLQGTMAEELWEIGLPWAEYLGFRQEGTLRAYGSGRENYKMIALVLED